MIELAAADVIFWVAGIVLSALITGAGAIYALLRGLAKYNDERQVLWDKYTEKTDRTLAELLEDHKEIKREITGISTELGDKVEKIMNDHAEHDKAMAAVLEMVRVIERRTK